MMGVLPLSCYIAVCDNKGIYVMLYVIWHHLQNLKNMKNTHGGVLLLVKLQAEATLLHGCFSHF